MLKEKMTMVEVMTRCVQDMNDETAYMTWIMTVPEPFDKDDLMDIAEDDDLFNEVCELFFTLHRLYGNDLVR